MSDDRAAWYIIGYLPGLEEDQVSGESTVDDVTLVAFNDADNQPDYIPVFNDLEECDHFVRVLAKEHKDATFAICSFESLTDIDDKVQEEFNRKIKIIVRKD